MHQVSRRRLGSVAGLVALFALVSVWSAAQSGPGTTSAVIPYQGYLERGGTPVTAPVDLRVGLFSSNVAGDASCLASGPLSGCGVWSDELSGVAVAQGRFSILLGSGAALPDDVFDAGALYLGLAVAGDGGSFVLLDGLQRLASVPYAVRAETSAELYVSRALGVGASPDETTELLVIDDEEDAGPRTAGFYSSDGARGLGVGPDRIAAVGSGPSQGITLAPKGDAGVVVEGDLRVEGGLTETVVRNRDGTEERYERSSTRYLVEASYQDTVGAHRYVQVPRDILDSYCGDEDGCTMTIGMRDYLPGIKTSTSKGPFHFRYEPPEPPDAGTRQWRRADSLPTAANDQAFGADGDGDVEHVVQERECYFTDGAYTAGSAASDDDRLGMGLLSVGEAYEANCWLLIDD